MRRSSAALAFSSSHPPRWLLSRRKDLIFLIGSAVLAPMPLLFQIGSHSDAVDAMGWRNLLAYFNLAATILISGPHLFSTWTYTVMERRFWIRHPFYAVGALVLPPGVIWMGAHNSSLLMGAFLLLTSLHLFHQVGFLADCYEEKSGGWEPAWFRAIDYGIVFASLYPLAVYRLVHGTFSFSGETLKIPLIHGNPIVFVTVFSLFLVVLLLFLGKTAWEWKKRRLHLPKLLLIALTVVVYLLAALPTNLDAAFHGLFLWHSFQYLAIGWWINDLRRRRKKIRSPFVQSVTGRGKFPLYYLAGVLPTLAVLGAAALWAKGAGLPYERCYLTVAAAGLIMHYYLDHWVFRRADRIVPYATLPVLGR